MVYFECSEDHSAQAEGSFAYLKDRMEFYKYEHPGEALTVIACLYQSQPFKLGYYAMKKCVEHKLNVKGLPEVLQDKFELVGEKILYLSLEFIMNI